jgi:hypothetical protein
MQVPIKKKKKPGARIKTKIPQVKNVLIPVKDN